MRRILAAAGMCVAGVSTLGAQAYRPGIGQLTPADVFLDGTNMGDSSRSLTTVSKRLQHLGPGLSPSLTLAFAMGMDRRDTSYTLVLSGARFDSLFAASAPPLGVVIDGHPDTLIGRRGFPKSAQSVDHIWYGIPVSLLRDIARGQTSTIRLVGEDRLGAWTLDEPCVALLRRFLGMAGAR
jgi:hypothetical protein